MPVYDNDLPVSEIHAQREFFARTAADYDTSHSMRDEHGFALAWLMSLVDFYAFESLLEVGAGTGRFLAELRLRLPAIGVEPVEELRDQGYARGLPKADLRPGDGYALAFPDDSFDVVAAFAVLHHVRNPELVVREMLRVSRRAVFISDVNNYGHGARAKLWLRALRLWPAAVWLKTRGRGYYVSEGDGIAYSYSVFDSITQLRQAGREVYVLSTRPTSVSLLASSSHAAVLAVVP